MPKPYEVTDPREILTDQVVENLLLIFEQSKLSIKEVYVKLADSAWKPFSLTPEPWQEESRFCAYLRHTEPFSKLCEQDRVQSREKIMQNPNETVIWYCPFGLRILGTGFHVGRAQIVVRTDGWLEKGNEGFAINKTLNVLESNKAEHLEPELLSYLSGHFCWTDAEVRKDSRVLAALLNLVRIQAMGVYERNVEHSKEEFIQDVSRIVVPLVAGYSDQDRKPRVQAALRSVVAFFKLDRCVFYFGSFETAELWTFLGGREQKPAILEEKRVKELLFEERGAAAVGVARMLTPLEIPELAPQEARACLVRFPEGTAGLLVAAPSGANPLLDDRMLSEITRTLSTPFCVSTLGAALKRAADLRWTQARNTSHTVRSTFQAVDGDAEEIRDAVASALGGQIPASVEEPLEHMEEMIGFMSDLLLSQDFVDLQSSRGAIRPQRLTTKKGVRILDILARTRESFKTRATALLVDIVFHSTLHRLPMVDVDERAMTLVFVNLIHNALKYGHRGTLNRRRTIDIKGDHDVSNVYIAIEDFGLGVHPAEEERIFEPFVQGSVEDSTRPISGQGLGLAAARAIARLHGGDVVLSCCVPYNPENKPIPRELVASYKPGSREANELLQHCLVAFQVVLPR